MSKVSDAVNRLIIMIADETSPDKLTKEEAATVLELLADNIESSLDALRDEMEGDDEAPGDEATEAEPDDK